MRDRVDNKCECCGYDAEIGKFLGDERYWLDVHERWDFDDVNGIQTLKRLIALCRKCHLSTHMGYSTVVGMFREFKERLRLIRGFNDVELDDHINEAIRLQHIRNRIQWIVDISILENSGIKLQENIV